MRLLPGVLLLAAVAACGQAPGDKLLFFRASPTAELDGLTWAPDPETGQLIALNRDLHVVKTLTSVSQPVAISAYCGHLLVSEYTGQGVLLDTAGHVLAEWDGPFPASLYSADGCRLLASRSPYLVQPFTADSVGSLVRELDSTGHGTAGYGALHAEALPFLIGPANAGALASAAGSFYFAPLARDEIVKYSGGAVVWTTKRGLYQKEEEPRFIPNHGREIPLLLARAGVALAIGPDGRLYALGADDSTASRLRLDVLDTATGAILGTHHLGSHETAVALDPQGALRTFDADSLLPKAAVGSRESLTPSFALPDLKGDTVRLEQFAGKVTLVNFWASWCDPCREEFPHMAALYGQFSRKDFDVAAISDDVDPAKMRAFVAAFRPPFPILVGGGRMRAIYHYRGLPYSLLLDRHGRVVERIFGFSGPKEFHELTATIAKEIAAP
jgi:thiol-disulfide isomerase/thioredoxin